MRSSHTIRAKATFKRSLVLHSNASSLTTIVKHFQMRKMPHRTIITAIVEAMSRSVYRSLSTGLARLGHSE
jgi:hypothetical protein